MGIKREYTLGRDFFRSRLLKLFVAIYILMILISAVAMVVMKAYPNMALDHIKSFMQSAEGTIVIDGKISMLGLFFNNLKASFMGMVLGLIPFFFLPIFVVLVNSGMTGAVLAFAQTKGISVATVFWGIVPHGIFEISALVLSVVLGVFFCLNTSRNILASQNGIPFVECLKNIARVFALFVVPLLIIAAAVETYITPLVIGHFL